MENIHLIFNKVYIIYSKSLLFLLSVVHNFLLSSQIQSVFFFCHSLSFGCLLSSSDIE